MTWGQHNGNIIIRTLFNPLLPLHWSQNTWPGMTLGDHFTLNFHYYEQTFLHTYCAYTRDRRALVELVYITWPAEMKRTVIRTFRRIFGTRRPRKDSKRLRPTLLFSRPLLFSPLSHFHWLQKRDLEWPWMAILRLSYKLKDTRYLH